MDVEAVLDNHGKRLRHLEMLEAAATAISNLAYRPFVWIIPDPAVETIGQIRIPWNCTVQRVDANTMGGTSCTFNLEERSVLGAGGTNVLTADMVADADGESVTASFNDDALAEGNHLAVDISAVNGAVDYVSITLTVTID